MPQFFSNLLGFGKLVGEREVGLPFNSPLLCNKIRRFQSASQEVETLLADYLQKGEKGLEAGKAQDGD